VACTPFLGAAQEAGSSAQKTRVCVPTDRRNFPIGDDSFLNAVSVSFFTWVRAKIHHVKEFATIKEAKDFLAKRIATEAEHAGVPLSEVERKMLYFSETDWTLPDIRDVSAAFDRDYDENEYERKIAGLVRKIERNNSENPDKQEAWDEALLKLSEEDHYLTVLATMLREAPSVQHGFIPTLDAPTVRPPHDRLKLWATAFVVLICIFIVIVLYNWIIGR
jgi:hypothetical protein